MARNEEKLRQLAEGIEAAGGQAIAIPVDVSKAEEIRSAFERTRKALGDVDLLLFNAAMRPFGRLLETKPSTFENTWRVNAFGAFLRSQEVAPAWSPRDGARFSSPVPRRERAHSQRRRLSGRRSLPCAVWRR
jgi:NAD(P)-dependent dehydrogenase (short-subunit alcohol dehydrogenase family)